MRRHPSHEGASIERRSAWKRILLVLLALLLVFFVLWQGGRMRREIGPRTVTIYSFSAMEDVMVEGILPAFQSRWNERTGERVEFITTFAGSGTLTDRIIRRFPAEVAVLASEIDADRLVRTGALPGPTWKTLPHGGVFARSPMVILVRPGNPLGIVGFSDLASEGKTVLFADPAASGAGELGILAVYVSALGEPPDSARAAELLERFWKRVVTGGLSARAAGSRFDGGAGDALITYEAEGIPRSEKDPAGGSYVMPPATIRAEPVVVPIGRNVSGDQRELVDSLVAFLWSDAAQEILVEHGFRSVDEKRNERDARFRPIERSFTLEEIGGPERAEEILLPFLSAEAAKERARP